MEKHEILEGKVQLFKRDRSCYWQCGAYICGKYRRHSTKRQQFDMAREAAERWYIDMLSQDKAGALTKGVLFKDAARKFLAEYEVITDGQRSPKWVQGHAIRLRVHLLPFFGEMSVADITAGRVQDYRVHRMTPQPDANPEHSKSNRPPTGKAPARKTIHNEIVTLRQVLKTAIRHDWLKSLPDLTPPYKSQGKVGHRAWFSHDEYKQLYTATRQYIKDVIPAFKWNAAQLHDYILFMANTGLRPDEAKNLEHRDVRIVEDQESGERILEIEVRGKRGVGFCKSTQGAVRPYERVRDRPMPVGDGGAPVMPKATDLVFPGNHVKMFNNLLKREGLKTDRDGQSRTAYSLRHTYICFRLMEGADIYQIAKNCRTSVEMIEKHYASHIKTSLNASAINVRKSRPARKVLDGAAA